MVALRNSVKWIPWPPKTLRMKNYLLRKVSILLYSPSKCWLIYRKTNIDWPSQGQCTWPKPSFTHFSAIPWKCASNELLRVEIRLAFGFCRYISSWKFRCLKLCLKKHGGKSQNIFHFESPNSDTPRPNEPKSVRYNYIHPWACLRNFGSDCSISSRSYGTKNA